MEKRRFFSLFFMLEVLNPVVESEGNFEREFRPSVSRSSSQNITPSLKTLIKKPERRTFARKERVKVKARIKLVGCSSKVRESFPKDNGKLLLKCGPGSRMKQRETTAEEEK